MKLRLIHYVIIIALALTLRLVLLDRIPIGINDDELDYVITAKAISITGKDLAGTWSSPISLTTPPASFPKAELPYILITPIIGLFKLSLFSARLPYVIFNILLILVLYNIAEKLFGRKQAFIVGLVAAINPWNFYFSRTAFDAPIAVFWFFLALYILLISKGWKILLAFLPLFLGFYCYIGTKIILIPLTLLFVGYTWYFVNKKKYAVYYLVLMLLTFTLFFNFLINLQKNQSGIRLNEISLFNNASLSNTVDTERRLSVKLPLTEIFSNKATVFTKDSINKFLGAFSVDKLFLRGEGSAVFSLWFHGMFYYLDFLFLILGFCQLYARKKKIWLFLVLISIVSILPSVLKAQGESFVIRSSLYFQILILFIGYGIWSLVNFIKNVKYKYLMVTVLIIVYTIQLANLLSLYFLRNPIYNPEGFGFSVRLLSRYITLAEKNNQKVIVIKQHPEDDLALYKEHLFYTDSLNKNTATQIANEILNKTYRINNATFTICPLNSVEKSSTIIIPGEVLLNKDFQDFQCRGYDWKKKKLSIANLSDGGEIFAIFDDKVCQKYQLSRYPKDITLEDLKVESLSEEKFCKKFITDLN